MGTLFTCISTFGTYIGIGLCTRDRPIWLFWGRYRYIGHSWTNSRYW